MDQERLQQLLRSGELEVNPLEVNEEGRKNRLTVLTTIHHEMLDEQPFSKMFTYVDLLDVDEETYNRRCKVGSKIQSLDFGWIEPSNIGRILIHNKTGEGLETNPTGEQKEEIEKSYLHLFLSDDNSNPIIIEPGRIFFEKVSKPELIKVCCPEGTASIRIVVYPR